jgi:hypothetical protein
MIPCNVPNSWAADFFNTIGAKPPFLGISAYGGKANLPIVRLDL